MKQFDMNDHAHRRQNILTGEWVLVSPHRSKRPWQGKNEATSKVPTVSHDPNCFLCAGNTRINGEINDDYKDAYVFQNDFGALQSEVPYGEISVDGLLVAQSEKGICKVICFSPDHGTQLGNMSVSSIVKVVRAWKNEYAILGALPYINHVQIFENKGDIMGCSNPHPHGQVWAQQSVPVEVAKEQELQLKHFLAKRSSLLGDYLKIELQKQDRIVYKNEHFVALVPFWATWPFETMILPRRTIANITLLTDEEEQAFADCIKTLTAKYDKVFDVSFPYSAGIHQAPTDGEEHSEWHMHMHFYPPLLRSATVKKFMVGYEMMAGPQRDITPESAAEILRQCEV